MRRGSASQTPTQNFSMRTDSTKHLILILLCAFSFYLPASAFMGNGTEQSPYLIYSADDLRRIPDNTTAHYRLMADIPEAYYTSQTFSGHFDGNGHYIKLMSLTQETNASRGGLFSSCTSATFSNLTMLGDINHSSMNSIEGYENHYGTYWNGDQWSLYFHFTKFHGGMICGEANQTTFTNCHNQASVSIKTYSANKIYGIGSDMDLGGLAGAANNCTFERCSNSGSLTMTVSTTDFQQAGPVYSPDKTLTPCYLGGLAGRAENTSFNNCFNTGTINLKSSLSNPDSRAGGISGRCSGGSVKRCYNTRNISAENTAGISYFAYESEVSDCFASMTNPCNTLIAGFTDVINCYSYYTGEHHEHYAEHDGEFVAKESFSMASWYAQKLPSWDFENVWYLPNTTDAFPQFRMPVSLSYEGEAKYGETVTFSSTNPYGEYQFTFTPADAAVAEGNKITFTKAGDVKVLVMQKANDKYAACQSEYTFNVAKANLSYTLKPAEMTYGDKAPEIEYEISGFLNNDNESCITQLPEILCDANEKSPVGTYNVVASGGAADNYKFVFRYSTVTVKPRPLQVTPKAVTSRYGQNIPTLTVEYSNWAGNDNSSYIISPPTAATVADRSSDAGEYDITCSGGSIHENYYFVYNTGTLTIEKADLSIGVETTYRAQGEPNPFFNLLFNGFRNNDTPDDLYELPTATCEADIFSMPGSYPVKLSGGSDRNYNYLLTDGLLIVSDPNSIESIVSDVESGAQVFTITGIRVDNIENLTPGIYIIREGNASRKIVIR